jgi:hypothetical protein
MYIHLQKFSSFVYVLILKSISGEGGDKGEQWRE